ncbi:hypothetical protein HZS_2912 [Henneguya salminicola]|nr:hypothetical protein HZS_2912 [Henneguya salminicola]
MKKIFIGGLPKSVDDEQLYNKFICYGDIDDHVVMKHPGTKDSRGFGFIQFVNEESVDKIINSRPHTIDNREIEVRRAMPKDINHSTIHERTKRVFIGGLNYDITDDTLQKYYTDKFSKYGTVESVEVKRDRESNTSRGFGFITFDSEDAVDAVLIMEPKPTQFGRNCEVKKSEPRRGDDSTGSRRRSRNDRRRSPYLAYYPPPYPRDYYERSPSQYRGYRDESPMYHEPSSFDRSYSSYAEYPAAYGSYDNGSQYPKNTTPRAPATSSYPPRPTNPASNTRPAVNYLQFEPGYREYEANPY